MLKEKLTLQEYLSIGYVYLIVLGIISDVIYFKYLNVDILNYSTVLDVLISPINILTKNLRLFLTLVGTVSISYFSMRYLFPKYHQKYRDKKWYGILGGVESADKMYAQMKKDKGIFLIFFLIFSMFIGMGFGRGNKVKRKIEKQEFEVSHTITFTNNQKKKIYLVGQNSTYLFYILKGEKEVSITTINQNIKIIKKIHSN